MSKKLIASVSSLLLLGTAHAGTKIDKDLELEQFLSSGEKYQIVLELDNQKLSKRICDQVSSALKVRTKSSSYKCYYGGLDQDPNRFNKYQLKFSSPEEGRINADFVLSHPKADDVEGITWTLQNPDSADFNKVLRAIPNKVVDYDQHGEKMKEIVFYHGLLNSEKIVPVDGQMFKITEADGTTRLVNKDLAKIEFMREREVNKNYMRAGLEVATFLGIGKALYIAGHDAMQEDWDFDNKSVSDFKNRIFTTDQMKFDDNAVSMNWGHAYAGVLYYSAARNNGFSSYESLLVALASSSIWEYAGEYKEVVSINDQIVTGIGGSIIGETLFQISNMLKSKDSLAAKIIGATINPVGTLNDVLDGKGFFHAHENFTRKLGFDSDGYSKMDIITGLKMSSNSKENKDILMAELGFDSEVVNLPVENVGRVKSLLVDPTLAELLAIGSVSENGIEDWRMVTKLALGGYFQKDIESNNGQLQGYSFLIAPAVRTEYQSKGSEHSNDFYAMVNVIGGTMDLTYYRNGSKIRFAVDVYGDFAFVRPYGLEKFQEAGGSVEEAKSVLAKRGYYYATGVTGIAKLSYESGKNEFGVEYTQHSFSSVDNLGFNRHEDAVTNDYSMTDDVKSIKIYYTRSVSERVKVSLGLERIMREGTMASINTGEDVMRRSDVDNRVWVQVVMPLK